MAVYVSPGVYVREVDLSLYIPALSTTIVGMVGTSNKGPTQTRTYVTNQQQFIDVFGEPDSTIGFESYAALQYLRRGRQLWFVRVVGPAAAAADASFDYEDIQAQETAFGPAVGDEVTFADTDALGDVLGSLPVLPGSVTFTMTIGGSDYEVVDDSDGALFLSDIALTGDITGTIDYVTGAWTITVVAGDEVDAASNILVDYSNATAAFVAEALSEGEWGNNISIHIEPGTQGTSSRIVVYYEGNVVERWDSVNLDDTSERYIETVINGVSDFITVTVDALIPTASLLLPIDFYTPVLLTGGDTDAANILAADIIGQAWDVGLAQPTGMQLFASPAAVDLNLLAAPGWFDIAVVNAMLQLCEARYDCMAVIDPPNDLTPQEVVDWHNGQGIWDGQHAALNSSYAALYYPWVKIYDNYNAQYVMTPPSGHVLAVYAFTDQTTESWFAPAGLNRGRVISGIDVAYGPTPGEMDLLYGDGNAVNPIASFTKDGIVVWGQRTLQRKPSALDRVNVRRLMLYLRKVISTSVRYLVFEPNDEKTWKLFGHLVIPYLNEVRQRRGLYDFRVKCDETTNTPEVIDRNEMKAQIFLKPVKAAEFIQVDLVITSTGANFDEVLY